MEGAGERRFGVKAAQDTRAEGGHGGYRHAMVERDRFFEGVTTEIVYVAPSIRLTEGKAAQEEPTNDNGSGSAKKRDAPRIDDGRPTATREAAQGASMTSVKTYAALLGHVRRGEPARISSQTVQRSTAKRMELGAPTPSCASCCPRMFIPMRSGYASSSIRMSGCRMRVPAMTSGASM